jgi:F-type H+-transporting ATPase subunit b
MGDMSAAVVAEGGGSNFLVPNGTFFVELAIFLIVLGVIGTFVVPPRRTTSR